MYDCINGNEIMIEMSKKVALKKVFFFNVFFLKTPVRLQNNIETFDESPLFSTHNSLIGDCFCSFSRHTMPHHSPP